MQRVCADLGGAAGRPDVKVQPTISRLEKAGRNRPSFDLKEPTDRAALGNFIVKAAQDLKSPLPFLRHAAIAERWQQHRANFRSEEHTSELQSLMRISYAVFCLKKKKQTTYTQTTPTKKST